MVKDYTVYKLTLVDGRVYIGMTHQPLSKRCRKDGYNGCPKMVKAINDYGWDAFTVSVIAANLSRTEAEQIEKDSISLYDSTNPCKGFNVALGGNIEGRHSFVTRQRMSSSQKGRRLSDEHLSKLRKPKVNGSLRRTVIQYDKDMRVIYEHPSLIHAVKALVVDLNVSSDVVITSNDYTKVLGGNTEKEESNDKY